MLEINNTNIETINGSINEGIIIPFSSTTEFTTIWSNINNETISEFTLDDVVYHGLKIREISIAYQDDGSFLARFYIELKTEADILEETVEALAQAAVEADAITEWAVDTEYTFGNIVLYDGSVYRVLQSHTSQSDWLPSDVPALYVKIYEGSSSEDEIPEWVQPDSTNPYMTGDKVTYNGVVYESLIDNNVWSPEAYPAGWQVVE